MLETENRKLTSKKELTFSCMALVCKARGCCTQCQAGLLRTRRIVTATQGLPVSTRTKVDLHHEGRAPGSLTSADLGCLSFIQDMQLHRVAPRAKTHQQENSLSEIDNPLLIFKYFGLLWLYQVPV